ncbi:MAG TPA: LuxR C-terminal-related transcriptional regulator [Zoogloea sp.]|uniref:helix-turn-helix transcriptional regulator n=1 Tax=Zoogloea sp. TaxID=49181 RepID=UPI002C80F1AD|nr:LuxR C-terminal-related transcriptional regulator [Zoogloea sp.]HMV17898.1 LuxR C-terminal-related transcriptional regulator [Rhodocyclaceae bacterium]HMV63217.1 LuxR C-terminal-related transcriptional regulator [Rhodocyclaceae bacterium]HMW52305.1 LuxR C-terminal-related transcriptional regulator [Rhodocyclaceae bacterium]HMY51194.1 LuxR C-terminal-related transcriptional regulator [Rhodocyclaceae bacterium]HMZ76701.1 LuxR C-terminal-related transcriptional regulator [Rhodocyclaceae bacter
MPTAPFAAPDTPPARSDLLRDLSMGLLLDELAFGIAVLARDRTLIYASRTALAHFHPGGVLQILDDLVEAPNARDALLLQDALDDVQSGLRTYLSLGHGEHSVDVAILPLTGMVTDSGTPAAIVFEQSTQTAGLSLYFYARAHGLTRAEERILGALYNGASVDDVATRIGCTPNTARTHVRRVLEKTGQPTLRALTARLGRLPPMAGQAD